eukprot:CAMPEP_0178410260 /NCGR_PEP_ID=MMETSP0689_2-20121128/20886_1 /TAXON_ID=160604 /ORGANISM="Amphidinium massartii, Strain CS-259" /LENGTH=204 /DNA_ID=CAMNT_0020031427 /DNA_START=81 /DNA_END=691 /DNA_ORIENTATION=-
MPIPGNTAAAIVGARRGRERAGVARGSHVPVRQAKSSAEAMEAKKRRAAEESAVLERLVSIYDKDRSGQLERQELAQLLRDYSNHSLGRTVEPDSDDMDFIMFIVDKDNSGCVDWKELKRAIDIWYSFLQERPRIQQLFIKYDSDGSCSIEQNELQNLLEELNDGVAVPAEVLSWIMNMGDLTGDGVLSAVELARATAAWYTNV